MSDRDRYEDNREPFERGRGRGSGRGEESERDYDARGHQENSGRSNWWREGQYPREYQGAGGQSERGEDWRRREGLNDYGRNYGGEQRQGEFGGSYYGERGFSGSRSSGESGRYSEQDYQDRGYNQGPGRDFRNERERAADWDRHRQRSMTTTYPRANEWSSGSGISTGLGGSENTEYSNYQRSGSYYGGQGTFGGGLSQYGNEGRHSGRGPKGYKRSDERIKEDVNERLTQDPEVDASEIEVEVKDGEVTLTGTVGDRHTKRRAEDVVEYISGVREVHNQLRVQQSGRHEMSTIGSGKQGTENKEQAGSGKTSSRS